MKLIDQLRREPCRISFGRGPSAAEGTINRVALDSSRDGDSVTITADDGSFVVIPGATGAAAGVLTATDKDRLDALAGGSGGALSLFETRADAAAASIPPFQQSLRTSGYHAAGDGGGGLYRRIAAAPGHGLAFASADGAWWELVPENGAISVLQAGAKGDGVADDHQPFLDAMTSLIARTKNNGGVVDDESVRVHVPKPAKFYRISAAINLKNKVHLVGCGYFDSADRVDERAHIVFDPDTTGFIVNAFDTTGTDVKESPGTGQARYSVFENISIAGSGTDPTRNGMHIRSVTKMIGCWVGGFPGCGVYSWNEAGSSVPSEHGNANVAQFERCFFSANRLDGVFLEDSDSNAMLFSGCNFMNNGRYGVRDLSLLGNYYVGCHFHGNGRGDVPGNGGNVSSLCSFGGSRYFAAHGASEAALQATTPGSNDAVWRLHGTGGADGAFLAWTGAEPVGTFVNGGAIAIEGAVNEGCMVACYTEGNQGGAFLDSRAVSLGGVSGASTYGNGSRFGRGNFGLNGLQVAPTPYGSDSSEAFEVRIRKDADVFIACRSGLSPNPGMTWEWNADDQCYQFAVENGVPFQFSTSTSNLAAGRTTDLPKGTPSTPFGIVIGNADSDGRLVTYGSAAPGNGEHAAGEIVFDNTPAPGGRIGWVCVTAGTPGVWKAFGAIDP